MDWGRMAQLIHLPQTLSDHVEQRGCVWAKAGHVISVCALVIFC